MPTSLNNGQLSSEGEIGSHCPRADVITIHRSGKMQQATDFHLLRRKREGIFSPVLPRNERSPFQDPPEGPKVSNLRSAAAWQQRLQRRRLSDSNSCLAEARRGEDSLAAARRLQRGALGPWNSGSRCSPSGRDGGAGGAGTSSSLCSGYSNLLCKFTSLRSPRSQIW